MHSRRTITTLTLSAALALGGLAAATPAQAYDYLHDGVRIRSQPYTSASVVGAGYPGQGAERLGLSQGSTYSYSNQWGTGTSSLWARNRNLVTGAVGWSGSFLIS